MLCQELRCGPEELFFLGAGGVGRTSLQWCLLSSSAGVLVVSDLCCADGGAQGSLAGLRPGSSVEERSRQLVLRVMLVEAPCGGCASTLSVSTPRRGTADAQCSPRAEKVVVHMHHSATRDAERHIAQRSTARASGTCTTQVRVVCTPHDAL